MLALTAQQVPRWIRFEQMGPWRYVQGNQPSTIEGFDQRLPMVH